MLPCPSDWAFPFKMSPNYLLESLHFLLRGRKYLRREVAAIQLRKCIGQDRFMVHGPEKVVF